MVAKKIQALFFPFQYSLFGFLVCFLVVTSGIFLGGNRPEYIAGFNIIVCFMFFIASFQLSKQIIPFTKILLIPFLIILSLFLIGYYQQLNYVSQVDRLSNTDMIDFIRQKGIYSPFGHFWSLAYWVSIFLMSIVAFVMAGYSGFKRGFIKFFFVFSSIIAVYGLIIYLSGNKTILWFIKDAYLKDLTATFINRNSYATFVGSGVLAGVYCIINDYKKFIGDYQGSRKTKIAGFIDYISSYRIIYVLSTLLLLAALILTHSRAGISLTIGFSCLLYFLASKQHYLNQRVIILLIVVLILSLLAPIIMQDFLVRIIDIGDHSALRFNAYKLIIKMIADYPVLGIGLGGFEYAFQAYQDHTIAIDGYWDKAHSTLLEIIVEIGIPLSIILFSFYAYIFKAIIKSYMKHKQSFLAFCLSVMGLYITHSCVDFSLQIPAINIMFHVILALGYAESRQRI